MQRGLAWWRSFRARLARVAAAAKLVAAETGTRPQIDGLSGRLHVNKAGNVKLLSKYGRVLVGTLRAEQWFYLGVKGVPEPPAAAVKEDVVDEAEAGAWDGALYDSGDEDDGLGADDGVLNGEEEAAAAAEIGAREVAAAAAADAGASDNEDADAGADSDADADANTDSDAEAEGSAGADAKDADAGAGAGADADADAVLGAGAGAGAGGRSVSTED